MCLPQSVRAKLFRPKWMPLQTCAPPISACSFSSRKLRSIRCPFVPSSVRVSQKFLTQMDAASEVPFALVALASQSRAPARSGLRLCQPQLFEPMFPAQVDSASAITCYLVALTRQAALSHVQVSASPRASQNFPSQMDAASELQPSLSSAVFRTPFPSLLIQLVPLRAAVCAIHLPSLAPFVPRPLTIPSLPQTQFSQCACRSPLPRAQSPCLVRALNHMDLTFPWEAPQAVPSIQSLQPPSHEGILGPSAADLLDEAFPRTTAKRKLDLLKGSLPFASLPLPPCVRAPYGTH